MRKASLPLSLCLFLGATLFLLQGCAGQSIDRSRFVDLGNGICQDKVTGTMWQKEAGAVIADGEKARQYAASSGLGGYTDWRLPTVNELYDLNYIYDLHLGAACPMEHEGSYWSAEKDDQGKAGAWEIADQCDPEREYFSQGKGRVRLIRP